MKKFIINILLASIIISTSLYGIILLSNESYALFEKKEEVETTLVGGKAIEMQIKKAYSHVTAPYTRIGRFPIDKYVFNSHKDYFCAQHGVEYGGKKNTVLGNGYHDPGTYTITKHKWSYTKGSLGTYATSMTADLDTTADYYANPSLKTSTKKYQGHKESTENPTDTVYTNWYYTSQNISFNCEDEDEKASLAFLLACYKSGGPNNLYTRGSYSKDPLQSAVWDSWINLGSKATNRLKYQGEQYCKYHKDSKDPKVDVIPADNVGTELSGNTLLVGPFQMSHYVRAKDYDCPRVNVNGSAITEPSIDSDNEIASDDGSTASYHTATLQDIFGTADDLQGDIIKVEAVVTNESGNKKTIDVTKKIVDASGGGTKHIEPDMNFKIQFSQEEVNGYDELLDIIFTYQRIHVSANGTIYRGTQYALSWKEKSYETGCRSYSCPSPASGCSAHTSPGTTSSPYYGTCTHTWYSGCWTTHHTGTRADGSSYSYSVHHHGTFHSTTHTVHYLCRHGHKDCKKFTWQNPTSGSDAAQDGFAGGGILSNELRTYKIRVSVPMKTQMSIYKYISKVDHVGENINLYNGGTERREMTMAEKLADSVKVERGDKVTFTIELVNDSRFETRVKVADVLPLRNNNIDIALSAITATSIDTARTCSKESWKPDSKIDTNSWIIIAGHNKVEYTLVIRPTKDSGLYTNLAEFITRNDTKPTMQYTTWDNEATHGAHSNGAIVNTRKEGNRDFTTELKEKDSDSYEIKEYKVSVEKYIYDVEHNQENISISNIDTTMRKSDERSLTKGMTEANKRSNPVYAEFGDTVTYKIIVYNTVDNTGSQFDVSNRKDAPHWEPDKVYVNLEDTLPKKYSNLQIKVDNPGGTGTSSHSIYSVNESMSGGNITVKNLMVPAGGKRTITVSLVVEEHVKGTLEENNVEMIDPIKNINRGPNKSSTVNNKYCVILNHSTFLNTSDFYKINDYNLFMDKYLYSYDEKIQNENNSNSFTTGGSVVNAEGNLEVSRERWADSKKKNQPVAVEKYETLVYALKAKNEARTEGGAFVSSKKPATQVRTTEITDYMQIGLDQKSVKAIMYNSDGSVCTRYSGDGSVAVSVREKGREGDFKVYTYSIGNETILNPSEYIVYYVTVEVSKNNMYLYNLENKAKLTVLTNINNSDQTTREIKNSKYNENISSQQVSSEFVKLKELVIAGRVWLDRDKDGFMGKDANGKLETGANVINVEANPSTNIEDTTGKEYAMQGIVVKLYKDDGTMVRQTKTDNTGMYTFGRKEDGATYYNGDYSYEGPVIESEQRIDKATGKDGNKNYTPGSKLINYYVEWEYDGLVYKSTSVYSDNKNLDKTGGIKDDKKYVIDSNGFEFIDIREEFNKNYEIVSYNKATKGDLSDPQMLEYEKKNHESYIRENYTRIMKSRSFIKEGTKQSIENTKLLWLYKESTFDKPETEYLKHINLGLEEREDVDISITQDVYELKTTVNGEEIVYEYNQNDYTLGNDKIDKKQDASASYDSERFFTGYTSDNSAVLNLYLFKYYLSDYNYRISQYHTDTVRAYKGSPSRNFGESARVNDNSIYLENYDGRQSELATEITFRIKVTNNKIDIDEPHKEVKDIKVYTGINEIVEYYDKDFVNLTFNPDNTIAGILVKEKDSNGYLVNKEIKILESYAVMSNGNKIKVNLNHNSKYNRTQTLEGYDTLYITPAEEGKYTNALTGNGIKAGEFILAEDESMDILIKFVVEKEIESPDTKELETILGAKENIAEINAYSTYYIEDGIYKSASLIDKDSNPGNMGDDFGGGTNVDKTEYVKYYEDDTFKTGINLLAETGEIPPPEGGGGEDDERDLTNRTLTGFVWDDARTEEAKDENGIQYIGDGIYDPGVPAKGKARKNTIVSNGEENDIVVEDVKVTLIEAVRMPDETNPGVERVYEDTIYANGEASIMETRTASSGKYVLKGFIPGEYIVRYTYGDDETLEKNLVFNGQDYKSTTYQSNTDVYAENATAKDGKTANDINLEILEATGMSDAKDDEIRRLEVISYSETMNNELNNILKGKKTSNPTALTTNTSMIADTARFLVRTEKYIEPITHLEYEEHIKKTNPTGGISTTNFLRFAIKNIDFGLQYRPELQLLLNKHISNITLSTSTESSTAEEILIDVKFDEYYGVVKNTDFLTGATTFITDDEGKIISVPLNATNTEIESALGSKVSQAQKNEDGKYVVTIAGTYMNKDTSIGLSNVQFLENEFEKDASGNIAVKYEDGKYVVQSDQGFAYLVVDDTILQGATIRIEYLLTGANVSEIDRISDNLSKMRYRDNTVSQNYTKDGNYYEEVLYQISSGADVSLMNETYSAAKTARNALFSEYYRYELNDDNTIKKDLLNKNTIYRVKSKDLIVNNKVIQISSVSDPYAGANEYYGRYLGSVYYTGKINKPMDVVANLKFNKILDYVDNNLVFSTADNITEDRLWSQTTSAELYKEKLVGSLVFKKTDVGDNTVYELIDAEDRKYDTEGRSNLALSADDRKRDDYSAGETDPTINKGISKFLAPRYSDSKNSFGTIRLTVSKVVSPEDKTDDMSYENIAEIIQYTSQTGRITNLATTIGNADIKAITSPKDSPEYDEGSSESDTASVEKITLTPPTGLDRLHKTVRKVVETASYSAGTIIAIIIVCVVIIGAINLYHRRRIK